MKTVLSEYVKSFLRPVKRALEAVIDNRIVDYHMPKELAGDLLITFDDGMHPDYTPRILDLLDQYNARAIFFVRGDRSDKAPPELLRDCHNRGHIIANHTYTHLDDVKGGRYSHNRVVADIERCSDLVKRISDQDTFLFRPPRGELNFKTIGAAYKTGHKIMLWSIEGGEWGKRSNWSAEDISQYLIENVKKRDVLLLHDDNEKSIIVISNLLEHLNKQEFNLHSGVTSLIEAHQ